MKQVWIVLKVVVARLRFLAIFLVAGLIVGYWDHIKNHVDKWTRPANQYVSTDSHEEWYCPMHPQVKRSVPGQCPICNMDLKKREPGEISAVPGRVQLTPQKLSLAGIATTQASFRPLVREVRALGVLDFDETRLANIAARVAGRADELFLTYTGQSMKAGDSVYSLYSPEVFTAQREYLQARKRVNDLPADASAEQRADASAVYNASMQKLVLWGISREQLDKLDKEFDSTGKVPTNFVVTSPITGIVVKKEINPGQYLQVGQSAYTVADLSTLWLRAKIYEADIPLVKIGQKVQVLVEAMAETPIEARVTFVAFTLDPETRTLDARIEVPNKELKLRPGMFATAVIRAAVKEEKAERPTSNVQLSTSNGNAVVLQKALDPYLKSSDLLAHDKIDGVSELLEQTVKLLEPIGEDAKLKEAYGRLVAGVKETRGEEMKELRETFKKVSLALIDIAKITGQPVDAPAVQIFRCPMKDKPYWLQVGSDTANPYMGQRMFDCGGPVEGLPKAAPAMNGGAAAEGGAAYVLSIPRSSVIDTGAHKIVFVQSAAGVFDMRDVTVGALSRDDFYPVLGGLKEGDKVVSQGAFLLDSENRLNPSAAPATAPSAPKVQPHVH